MFENDEMSFEDLEALFAETTDKDQPDQQTPPADSSATGQGEKTPKTPMNEGAQSVHKRLEEVRAKTERETLERVAKEAGFESYQSMQDAKVLSKLKEKGLDDNSQKEMLDTFKSKWEEMKKTDPDFIELQRLKTEQANAWATEELTKFNKTIGLDLKVSDIPPEVFKEAAEKQSLTKALMAWKGDEILRKALSAKSGTPNPTMGAFGNQQTPPPPPPTRQVTEAERKFTESWKQIKQTKTDPKDYSKGGIIVIRE